MKCSLKQATTLAVKTQSAYEKLVAYDVLRSALAEERRAVPARVKKGEKAAMAAYKAVDRKRRACGRAVGVRVNAVENANNAARKLARRLKIKVAI